MIQITLSIELIQIVRLVIEKSHMKNGIRYGIYPKNNN